MKNVEILAPAGSKEAFISAINNGADAIYIGGKSFGARAFANNFTNEEITDMIALAHSVDVKVYVTVNTLIKDHEFKDALEFVDFLYQNNCDAIIIQDLGLLDVVRQTFLDLPLHASTQMNIHSVGQAQFLKSLGIKRIVLARETPMEIIKEIIDKVGIEIEVFVHGALCMSFSGNCFMSSVIGKRSGNRGRCAQPCRLLYELEGVTDKQYLLSTKDLMTIDKVQELKAIGVTSFKIEGRMKRAEYVGLVVKSYKEALHKPIEPHTIKNLQLMFNREFTKGFIFNENNADITNIISPNHIGVLIGSVQKYANNYAYIKLNDELNVNDSIRIKGNTSEDAVTINEMFVGHEKRTLANQEVVKIRTHVPVEIGAKVLKTTDMKLLQSLNNQPEKKINLDAKVFVEGDRLALQVTDSINYVKVLSVAPISIANNPQYKERLIEQLHKTNNTHYQFGVIDANFDNIFLPIKDINEMRRKALDEITKKRLYRSSHRYQEYKNETVNLPDTKRMFVKVRNESQLQQAIQANVKDIIIENKQLLQYASDDVNIYLMSPRIETQSNHYDGISYLNLGNNHLMSSVYLNVMNAYSVNFFHKHNIQIVGLSIELSKDEMAKLINQYKQIYHQLPNVMVMVYGYYDLMITKHCLINKALGLKNKHCRKCYEQQYYLKDRLGFRFPLIDDGNCNLKVLNSKRVHLIKQINELKQIGVNNILLDFTIEDDIGYIIKAYQQAFNNQEINLDLNDVTYGHFKEGVM